MVDYEQTIELSGDFLNWLVSDEEAKFLNVASLSQRTEIRRI